MKIAVLSSQVFPIVPPFGLVGYGGLEALAWLQAKGLIERGHQVTLIAPDGSHLDGATMFHTGPPRMLSEQHAYGGTAQRQVQMPDGSIQLIRKVEAYWPLLLQQDCVLCHTWEFWPLILKQEGRLPKTPILCWTHAPVDTMFKKMTPVQKPCFVNISEDQGHHFHVLFNRDSRVCYNGVDVGLYYKSLGIPRSDRFLFLARFSIIKGADLAIEACLKAGVGLDLIGDTQITNEPEYHEKCMQLAKQTSANWDHSKGQQIRILGGKNRGECVWYFSQAHCLLHPNERFREPFGLSPVEAQACGCPVLTFDYGAMRETTVHGKTGWLVKTVDEFNDLVVKASQGISQEMRTACRENAKRFSVDKMIDRVDDLVHEAVSTGGW